MLPRLNILSYKLFYPTSDYHWIFLINFIVYIFHLKKKKKTYSLKKTWYFSKHASGYYILDLPRFPCPHCEYKATTASHLKKHKESVHEGIKYKCNECEHESTTKESLKVRIVYSHPLP